MPRQLHRDGGEFEISHSGAWEVVQDAPWTPRSRHAVANALLNDLIGFGRNRPLRSFATMRKNTHGTTLPRFLRRSCSACCASMTVRSSVAECLHAGTLHVSLVVYVRRKTFCGMIPLRD